MTKIATGVIKKIVTHPRVTRVTLREEDGSLKIYYVYNGKYPSFDRYREVKLEFEPCTLNNNYGTAGEIKGITYGKYIKDRNVVIGLLEQIGLTKGFVAKVMAKYEDPLDMVFNHTSQLTEISHPKVTHFIDEICKYKGKNNAYITSELTNLCIPHRFHQEIINRFGDGCIDYIKSNIYELYIKVKVPFEICDRIAMELGYDKDDNNRIESFIKYFYKKDRKYLYYNLADITKACLQYSINTNLVIPKLLKINVRHVDYYTSAEISAKEDFIESICSKLVCMKPLKVEFDEAHLIEYTQLDKIQRDAIRNVLANRLSIITGGPGTGKSYLIFCAIRELQINSKTFVLAPTGAAVERLRQEKSKDKMYSKRGIEFATLHSFIYSNGNAMKNIVGKNPMNVKELYGHYREFTFFIDEVSMVDTSLFYKFTRIISGVIDKVRLVLLGDKNQLPSICGGDTLNDLINSGYIEVTTLTKIYRTKGIEISLNANRVLEGKELEFNNKNFIHVTAHNLKQVSEELLKVIEKYHIAHQNSCVIIPIRKTGICVNEINPLLQEHYNGANMDGLSFKVGCNYIYEGDKIMNGKNDKKKEIYNGSILTVDEIIPANPDKKIPPYMDCIYEFNHRGVVYTYEEIKDSCIDLAYASTVHKVQGKGYDTVIIILHSSMYRGLLNKSMLYTAITRAKNRCIIISDSDAIDECVARPMEERITNLYRSKPRPFVDDMIMISQRIPDYCKNNTIRKLLKRHGINVSKLIQYRGIGLLYRTIMQNDELYKQLLFDQQNICDDNKPTEIMDVIEV